MGRAEDKRQAARDAAAHHGLKAAVPHYLEAAQALVEARRPEEAVDLLGELLVAQEKKRGLFSRVEKNPLGPSRAHVAVKFAEYSRMAAPTEDVLELLSELSLEQPDDLTIRRANADALYNAGYIADATEEYRYCLRLSPDEGQILSRLTDAYAEMGRNDHAIEFLRRGMRVHADAKDYGQAMHLAIRWLGIAPGAAEDVLILLKDWPADALRRQIGGINQLAMLAKKDDTRDATWHKAVAAEFAALGASGRPELATEPPAAAKPSVAPTPAAQKAPEVRPAAPSAPVAPPPTIAPSKPAAAQPAAPSAPAAAASAKPTPAMAKPIDPKPTAPPAPAPAKPAVPASEQLKIIQPQRPTAASAQPARPAQPTPAQPSRPAAAPSAPHAAAQAAQPAATKPSAGTKPSGPLPTLEKVLEEADTRKTAAPSEPARPAPAAAATPPAAKPPTDVKPAAPAPAATAPPQRPPMPPQRPTAPPPQATVAQTPAAPPKPAEVQPPAPAPAAAQPAAAAEPARAAAGGTAAGIKNFARRKAKELYDAGDYENAVASLERVARFGADAETLQMLLTCYAQLNRPNDAKRVGMELADLEVEAGRVESAVAALTTLAKTVPDPDVLKRRSELLASKK